MSPETPNYTYENIAIFIEQSKKEKMESVLLGEKIAPMFKLVLHVPLPYLKGEFYDGDLRPVNQLPIDPHQIFITTLHEVEDTLSIRKRNGQPPPLFGGQKEVQAISEILKVYEEEPDRILFSTSSNRDIFGKRVILPTVKATIKQTN